MVWIQMDCIFLWQFHHLIQVLLLLIWSVRFASFQANLFLGPIPMWLQETLQRHLPFQGRRRAHAITLLSHCYPLYPCSKRWCQCLRDKTNHFGSYKETWIKPELFQSAGFEPFGSILPKCSWTLTKSIRGLLQLEDHSGHIHNLL